MIFKTTIFTLVVLSFVIALSANADDFQWSWENKKAEATSVTNDAIKNASDKETSDASDTFKWEFEESTKSEEQSLDLSDSSDVKKESAVVTKEDKEAYAKILAENLELRRKMAELMKNEEVAKRENARLQTDIKDLENKISALVGKIKRITSDKNNSIDPDTIKKYEAKLILANKEKQDLIAELQNLKAINSKQIVRNDTNIKKNSALYKQVEKENLLLKKKLLEIETERRNIEREKIKIQKAKEQALKKAEQNNKKLETYKKALMKSELEKKAVIKHLAKVPELENELTQLKKKVETKDDILSKKANELEELKAELDRREYRLRKAEQAAKLLEQATEDIKKQSDQEKLTMHYNMAVVYTKEGRYKDAEKEYLKVLEINPEDADTHYNLGILYDDHLNKKRKAAQHYRRYIKLRPTAPDVHQVREWLFNIEMHKK